jgi:hypothetical protein
MFTLQEHSKILIFACKKDSECELLHWKYVYLNDHPGSMPMQPMHVHRRDGAALVWKVLQKLGLSEKAMLED